MSQQNTGNVRTVGARLWLLAGLLITTIAFVGALSFWSIRMLSARMDDMVMVQLPAVRTMGLVDMMHDGIRGNALGTIVFAEMKNKELIDGAIKESKEFADDMNKYVKTMEGLALSESSRTSLNQSKVTIDNYERKAAEIVKYAAQGQTKEAYDGIAGMQEDFENLEKTLGQLGDSIAKEAEEHGEMALKEAKTSIYISLVLTCLGGVFGLFVCLSVIRSIRRELSHTILQLNDQSKGVHSSAENLSISSNELASETTQQASALQETASSMDEIAAMVKLTADNSRELETAARSNRDSAHEGQKAMEQMMSSIEIISASNDKVMMQVEDNNKKITEIVQMMGEISSKTKVINDIVFQTKLLSFNASVEAARAGEHGKGFAVVAEEVGNLARMSGSAAKEITDLLDSSVRRAEEIVQQSKRRIETLVTESKSSLQSGVQVARECDDSLVNILKQSELVNERITAITQAIREQDQGIQEVTKALRMLDQSTSQNDETAKKTRALSEGLLNQSSSLDGIVTTLQSLAGIVSGTKDSSKNDAVDGHGASVVHVDRASDLIRTLKTQQSKELNHASAPNAPDDENEHDIKMAS
jgi:methyl-accepting chemotaxis protein